MILPRMALTPFVSVRFIYVHCYGLSEVCLAITKLTALEWRPFLNADTSLICSNLVRFVKNHYQVVELFRFLP